MTWKRAFILGAACAFLILALGVERPPAALATPEIFASPVHAGCYLAKMDRCKIHVEPFTLNLASGTKLVRFQLTASRAGGGSQQVIYDFRPDASNPAPASGSTFTPSLVAQDFAATCGEAYTISLQGQDSGDATLYNLGATTQFTCPKGTYPRYLPAILNP